MKKKLLLCLSLALIAAMVITGTMAYFTDTDSDANVMTLGNVDIAQHEYERVVDADGNYEKITVTKADGSTQESYKLQEFTQAKPLFPAVGDPNGGYDPTYVRFEQLGDPNKVSGGQQFFANLKNAQDKIVLVENTGKSDAYVRTIFAFEMGKLTSIDEWHTIIMDCTGNNGEPWSYKYTGVINIDGNNFAVMEAVYTGYSYGNMRHNGGILPAGEWTYNSLAGVYMTADATNEDAEAIDGNKNGTYDILVLSQAVQTAGFDDALTALDTGFGKTSEKAAEWFGGIVIPSVIENYDDAAAVFANGGDLYLVDSVSGDNYVVDADTTVNVSLNENELDGTIVNYGTLNVTGGTVSSDAAGLDNYGDATYTDVTMNAGNPTYYAGRSLNDSVTVYNNFNLTSAGGGVAAAGGAQVTFNGGSVAVNSASTSGRYLFYTEGEGSVITINGGDFSFSKTLNQKRAYIYASAGTTVYVNGGNFGPASTRSGYTAGILGEGTVIITGGNFGFDPSNWVADGYQTVKSGSTWTVSAVD